MADALGAFEQAVLITIIRLGDEAYGRAILKDVQERLERDVAPGAVHATLDRLEKKGLLSSKLGSGHARPRRPRAPLLPLDASRRPRAQRRACGGGQHLARPEMAAGQGKEHGMTIDRPTTLPPQWAESLLRLILRPDDRDSVSGDLLEEYRESIVPALGATANRWYIRQVRGTCCARPGRGACSSPRSASGATFWIRSRRFTTRLA